MLIIENFPSPPSVNNSLMPIMGKIKFNKRGKPYAQGRMVKTPHHHDYTAACLAWSLHYQAGLGKFRTELLMKRRACEEQKKTFALKVEYFFFMHRSKLLTVNAKPEQLDVDNRIKPCQDNLMQILNLDDKHIFSVTAEKVCILDSDKERVMISISEFTPRSGTQVSEILLKS